MTPEQQALLASKATIGQDVWFKQKGNVGPRYRVGRVVDEVSLIVADYKHLIQKIAIDDPESWEGQDFGYRTGYYTFDAKGKRLLWGQYTQFLTASQYRQLLVAAREKGWGLDLGVLGT